MADAGNDQLLVAIRGLASENTHVAILKGFLESPSSDVHISTLCTSLLFSVIRVEFGATSFLVKRYSTEAEAKATMAAEYSSLEHHQKSMPGSAPEPYCRSDKDNLIVMEDFRGYQSFKAELEAGRVDHAAIGKLADTLGHLHRASHGPAAVAALPAVFSSNPQTAGVRQALFIAPFDAGILATVPDGHLKTALTRMHGNTELGAKVAALKVKAEAEECLVHGNLTTDAVVVKDGEIKLLANQLATVGACAYDVGVLLAQYLALYHTHMLTEENNDAHRQVAYKMVEAVTATVDTYLTQMSDVLGEDSVKQFVSDVAGFSGIELVRKATAALSVSASVEILESGLRLVGASHRIFSASLLANIALMLTF